MLHVYPIKEDASQVGDASVHEQIEHVQVVRVKGNALGQQEERK